MLYYRRKVLLAILEVFGGNLQRIKLQKLLLMFSKYQQKPAYDFLPYRFGCYSFQSTFDLRALTTYGYIESTDKSWNIKVEGNYASLLTKDDQMHLVYLYRKYQNYSTEDLVRETYVNEPYYAIRSEWAEKLLTDEQFEKVKRHIPVREETCLYTIGYEGVSIEKYFNKLILNDVKVLCDVRRNPISQKVGFSKADLRSMCDALGILYIHMPHLGIPSSKRQSLNTQRDYNLLFDDYVKNHLVNQAEHIHTIEGLLRKHQRVALTCMEASHHQCHRGCVATAVTQLPDQAYKLTHL